MEENNNKKMLYKDIKLQTWILIVSICLVILVVIGSSYAAFVWNDTGSNQSVSSGNYTIEIENTSGTTITLANAYPMSDTEGKATTPYKFTIRNSSNIDVEFSLKLVDDGTSTINKEYLKVNLTGGNNIDVAVLKGLPDNELDAGILEANSSKNYELRLWISNSAPNSTIGGQYSGKLTLDTKQIEQTGATYVKGDVNMNGIVDSIDIMLVTYYLSREIGLTSYQMKLADTDDSGEVLASDLLRVKQAALSQNSLSYQLSSNIIDYRDDTPNFTVDSTDNDLFVQVGDGTRTKNGIPILYYRGAVENNYISFAGQLWRVLRVNEDGTVRLITQNNITEVPISYSTNGNTNYKGSYAESVVNNWYQETIESNYEYDSKVVIGEFCNDTSQESRSGISRTDDTILGESTPRPIFKCPKEAEIIKSKVGTLTTDELMYAGAFTTKMTNNVTYLDNGYNFWTMTPVDATRNNGALIFGEIGFDAVNQSKLMTYIRPVINLKADVTVSGGTGTSTDPYVVE